MIYKKFLIGIISENILVEYPTVQRCEMRLFAAKAISINSKEEYLTMNLEKLST
jgi:hypothetical protein